MLIKFDELVGHSTDLAMFCLYHPEDYRDRMDYPFGWSGESWLVHQDFETGKLVSWSVDSDGLYNFKFTFGELEASEKGRVAHFEDYRLAVIHGGLVFDNGGFIPNRRQAIITRDEAHRWLELENGFYHVRVNALDWHEDLTDEQLAALPEYLPHYVIQFRQVDSLDSVPQPNQPTETHPQIRHSISFHKEYDFTTMESERRERAIHSGEFPSLISNEFSSEISITFPAADFIKMEEGVAVVNGEYVNIDEALNDHFRAHFPEVVFLPESGAQKGLLGEFSTGEYDYSDSSWTANYSYFNPVLVTNHRPSDSANKHFALLSAESPAIEDVNVPERKLEELRSLLHEFFLSDNYKPSEWAEPAEFVAMKAIHINDVDLIDRMATDSNTVPFDSKLEFDLLFCNQAQQVDLLIRWLRECLQS